MLLNDILEMVEEKEIRRRNPRRKKIRRGKSRPSRARSQLKILKHRHRPFKYLRPHSVRRQNEPCIWQPVGTELVRWVQSSLNQIMGLRLRVNGVMNRATREALRDFQKQEGMAVDGIVGPETKKALIKAKKRKSVLSQNSPGEYEQFGELTWEMESNRKSKEYIRWLQDT